MAYAVGRGILGEAPQQFGEFAVGPDIDAIVPDALVPETSDVERLSGPIVLGPACRGWLPAEVNL